MNPVTIVLPEKCLKNGIKSEILLLKDPRTGQPRRYLLADNQLYELTSVNGTNPHITDTTETNSARSLMFSSNRVVKDANVVVSTPIDALFLVLPTLHRHVNKFLTAEYIQDIMDANDDEFDSIPVPVFENSLSKVCETRGGSGVDAQVSYRLSTSKLFEHLTSIRDSIVNKNALPRGLYAHMVESPLRPVDATKDIDGDMLAEQHRKIAMELLCSYLTADLAASYMKTEDFTALDSHVAAIATEKRQMIEAQNQLMSSGAGAKRTKSAPVPAKKAPALSRGVKSLQKTNVSGNRSLMDMFARKTVN